MPSSASSDFQNLITNLSRTDNDIATHKTLYAGVADAVEAYSAHGTGLGQNTLLNTLATQDHTTVEQLAEGVYNHLVVDMMGETNPNAFSALLTLNQAILDLKGVDPLLSHQPTGQQLAMNEHQDQSASSSADQTSTQAGLSDLELFEAEGDYDVGYTIYQNNAGYDLRDDYTGGGNFPYSPPPMKRWDGPFPVTGPNGDTDSGQGSPFSVDTWHYRVDPDSYNAVQEIYQQVLNRAATDADATLFNELFQELRSGMSKDDARMYVANDGAGWDGLSYNHPGPTHDMLVKDIYDIQDRTATQSDAQWVTDRQRELGYNKTTNYAIRAGLVELGISVGDLNKVAQQIFGHDLTQSEANLAREQVPTFNLSVRYVLAHSNENFQKISNYIGNAQGTDHAVNSARWINTIQDMQATNVSLNFPMIQDWIDEAQATTDHLNASMQHVAGRNLTDGELN